MPELIAKSIAYALYAYVAVGLLFASAFVCFFVQRLDEQARGAGWGFRLVVFPGALVLWPVLARRLTVALSCAHLKLTAATT